MMVRYNARMSVKKDRAVMRRVLVLAMEEEEPLERQFDLNFDLLFNTVGYTPPETPPLILIGGTMQRYVRTLSYDHTLAREVS